MSEKNILPYKVNDKVMNMIADIASVQCAEVYFGKTGRLSFGDILPFRVDKLPQAVRESI